MAVTITHSTPADGTFSATGAAAWDASHSVSGLGTMAEQNSNNVNITGGSITGVTGVLTGLTVNSTPTSGGAAGQIMFDTGSVLQESSNLVWDNTNNVLRLVGATKTGATLSGVTITGTAGQFSCSAASVPLVVGQLITISGTFGGTGSITGYASPTTYVITATNGSTTFTLSSFMANAAISTTAGTPTGLTYTYDPYPVLNASQVWNNSNLAFQGLKLNVTNTAATTQSVLFDFQLNGLSRTFLRSFGAQTWNLYNVSDNATVVGQIFYTYAGTNNPAIVLATDLNQSNRFNIRYQSSTIFGFGFQSQYSTNLTLGVNSSGNVLLSSAAAFGWNNSTLDTGTQDVFLTRRAAANLRFGAADAAAPVAQTLSVQSVVAGTSNTAGANLTITGSQGTGTGAGGSIIFQVAPAGSSGTAQNALTSTFTLNSDFLTAGGIASFTSNFNNFGGIFLRNTNNTASGSASTGFTAQNDSTAQLFTRVYGTGVTASTVWGITLANYSGVFSGGAASNGLLIGTATAAPMIFGTNTAEAFRVTSTQQIQIGSSNQLGWSTDLILTRRGAANLRFGAADAAAPVAQTLSVQSVVAGTTNTAGANLTITGSQGTGTGAGGSIIFQVAPAGSTGTAQNALATAFTIASTGLVSAGTLTSAALTAAGGTPTFGVNSNATRVVFENTAPSSSGSGGILGLYENDGGAMALGDRLGIAFFGGSSSASALRNTAAFVAYASENWVDASAYGTRFAFEVNANGATSRTERFAIEGNGLVSFGGSTSSFPALKRSTTILQVRLADDSAYAPVEASTVRTATAYTVATLPAAGTAGRKAYVTDALAPTFLGVLTGGGTVVCPVFDNGTAWVAG